MDSEYMFALTKGTHVTVYLSKTVTDISASPPLTATAMVMEQPHLQDTHVWLELQMGPVGQLPQLYQVQEIIGLVMRFDLVTVERLFDESTVIAHMIFDHIGNISHPPKEI